MADPELPPGYPAGAEADVVLPSEATAHPALLLHPVALDAALQTLAAALPDEAADGDAEVLSGAEAEAPDGTTLRGAPSAAAVAEELAARCGTTLCFAQLWSLARPEELQEDPWAELGADLVHRPGWQGAVRAVDRAGRRKLAPGRSRGRR